MSDLDLLLKKYRQGTISDQEMEQLNTLTRRDQVVEAACRRATTLRRRRQVVLSVSAVVLLLGGVGALLFSNLAPHTGDSQLFAAQPDISADAGDLNPAQSAADAAPVTVVLQEHCLASETMSRPIEVASNSPRQTQREQSRRLSHETAPVIAPSQTEIPQVMCNVGCNADSVINDVWDFLNA